MPHPLVLDLGLPPSPDRLVKALRDIFGYDSFRPGQREVIEAVMEGRDCIAVMPTGAGKSLTFQWPVVSWKARYLSCRR